MKRLILASAATALALSLLPASARAQVEMQISIGLPVAPPLVVVQPGVQVVENYGEEVFFVGGWYWCRRGPHWYRARTPRATFVYVEPVYVPTRLSYLPPPGHYKHWERRRMHEERRWWKEHEHERRHAWKEHEARRAEWKHDNGRHRGWEKEHGNPHRQGSVVAPAPERGHASVIAPSRDSGQRPVVSRPPERGHTSVLAPSSSDRGRERHHERGEREHGQ